MAETTEVTRAAKTTAKKTTAKKTTSTAKKTSAAKKTTAKKTTAKKATTAKKKTAAKKPAAKKTSSSTTLRLTAKEKKLVQSYRDLGMIQKKLVDLVMEKLAEMSAGGTTKSMPDPDTKEFDLTAVPGMETLVDLLK